MISSTKGYVYIPAPWCLTKEFYFKFEDTHKSYKFKYEFEGCGLRYMIAEFASLIQRGKRTSKTLSPSDIVAISRVVLDYNEYREDRVKNEKKEK